MLLDTRQLSALPRKDQSRLTFRRLRRPTRLPTMSSAHLMGRYLDRLRWMFSAG